MPAHIDQLETPTVLIDVDRVEANLTRTQTYADAHGLKLRPHIKTHKLPRFAHRQVELGAIGITCQKLGEAEVMADAGIEDILLPYNIMGAEKLHRLRRLADRVTLAVTADSLATIEGYARAFANATAPLRVLVECDTGMGRCGVQTPDEALALAQAIDASPGLVFEGLMTYPPAGAPAAARAVLAAMAGALRDAGLPPTMISTGGTPDLWAAHETRIATEYRPGTYIYLDRYQVAKGVGTLDDCALTVLTTVVSRPTPDRAVIDAGSKALTSDLLGLSGHGLVMGYPDAVITGLSEEHGTIDLSASERKPAIGERLRIVPNHACPVSNLFDRVHLVSGEHVSATETVAARGRVD
ncbi:D-serine deaminase, pyridoxal phosphate-dependent [Kaistia soli DSM 19436]|uniref:D-serine deaminase, pyridoxal phosphate-dependent n=1 Tax=Kaistia soli DSM 19436 TaxID=1122133 RepID=A0A1M4YYF1_9HYPH|nr:D-TA family PLP-dependent enzyme [Kaistia soli]SHF10770.1 D-serine deaminase, pyridoxal phosphate-dependent [Kaistia soli DSM 19436]